MRTINWRGSRINIKSQTVQVASHQLELRRCFLEGKRALGPPVFAVAGFLETVDIFFSRDGEGGLAPFLAALGFDVYLAEMRGRGASWPVTGKGSSWGLEESIKQDIPAHLEAVARQRPGEPQFWMGQGLGSLLLHEVYARRTAESPAVLGMIHFGASRQIGPDRRESAAYRRQWIAARSMALLRGYVGIPFSDPPRRETRQSLLAFRRWQQEDVAQGAEGEAHQRSLPPSLYFANSASSLWGNPDDCRRWMRELGPHDGRLVAVGKKGGNLRNYSPRELLQHPVACEDHFLQLQEWLEERREKVKGSKVMGQTAA